MIDPYIFGKQPLAPKACKILNSFKPKTARAVIKLFKMAYLFTSGIDYLHESIQDYSLIVMRKHLNEKLNIILAEHPNEIPILKGVIHEMFRAKLREIEEEIKNNK